jgi:hypothetical protein
VNRSILFALVQLALISPAFGKAGAGKDFVVKAEIKVEKSCPNGTTTVWEPVVQFEVWPDGLSGDFKKNAAEDISVASVVYEASLSESFSAHAAQSVSAKFLVNSKTNERGWLFTLCK